MAILAVNAGSSTLKFNLYPLRDGQVQVSVLAGSIQGLEPGGQAVMGWHWQGQSQQRPLSAASSDAPFAAALRELAQLLGQMVAMADLPPLLAVAHRVVHGGSEFCDSVLVDESVLERLAQLNSLAPLHQPHNLQGMRAFAQVFAQVPQVACFDTAYHATLAPVDVRFAIPDALVEQGVRRYGFHGLSYQYIIGALQAHTQRAQGRVLMAHLGNGASLCGAIAGLSRSTTMGFSALDGLMMGTRSGAIDPGVLLYLLEQGWDHPRIQTLLYKQSGLLGVSGISADMRRLRADASEKARLAIDLFTHRVVREAGAMVACLQGLDVLAFSGGIGENDAQLRADVAARLGWLGVRLDAQANALAVGDQVRAIHVPDSAVELWVVPTDEGLVAARQAARLVAAA